jgi:hypothetical protein
MLTSLHCRKDWSLDQAESRYRYWTTAALTHLIGDGVYRKVESSSPSHCSHIMGNCGGRFARDYPKVLILKTPQTEVECVLHLRVSDGRITGVHCRLSQFIVHCAPGTLFKRQQFQALEITMELLPPNSLRSISLAVNPIQYGKSLGWTQEDVESGWRIDSAYRNPHD